MKAWQHFRTINHHRLLVMKGCFKVGLYRQGLLHDLSKYSPSEFLVGIIREPGVPIMRNGRISGIPGRGFITRGGTGITMNIGLITVRIPRRGLSA